MTTRRRPVSGAWRGALWITLIALVTTGLALTLQYLQTSRFIEARRHAAVDDEAADLLQRYRTSGLYGVADAISRQQSIPRIHEFFYLLTTADGTPLAGNLPGWPPEVKETGFHSFQTDVTKIGGQTSRRWFEARAVQLDGGVRLLVGDFADQRKELRDRYLAALGLSMLATGLLGLALGWIYSRRGLRFVDDVSEAGEKFLAGRLTERLPVSGRGDEFDRLAETINRCFAEVERLVASLRAATDGLAHDLRTPLTRIRARLELSDLEHGTPEGQQSARDAIRQDLDTLLLLINDMLSLARAEATPAAQFVPVGLDAIVGDALEIYEPVAEDKAVRVEADIGPAVVLGHAALLARLVANLLDNAIKFSPDGGSVGVTLRSEDEGAVLVIADQGPGIAPDKHEAVLRRFGRLDESRSSTGNGLGLSIVDAVTRVHGARLALVDNEPGLRVEVHFPPIISTAVAIAP